MKLLTELYGRCLWAHYVEVEENANYACQRDGDTLYILFQETVGKKDWLNNFDFPAKPYSDMGIKWYCHRGFLRVWKAIKPYLKDVIMDPTIKKIYIVGYSHGAAIATLAHEYVWFNRPDLRESIRGFGFGCPRCYWGFKVKASLKERWKYFFPIRNLNDIVTHVPPALFGFKHVNDVYTLKNKVLKDRYTKLKCVDAHYPRNYMNSVEKEPDNNIFQIK